MGPDSDTLIDGEKTTHLGKPVGKDSGINTWEGDQWQIGGGTTWGWYSYDPELNLVYLRLRQPVDLEPEAASGRQSLVHDLWARDLDTGVGQMGLSDDPPRRVGL